VRLNIMILSLNFELLMSLSFTNLTFIYALKTSLSSFFINNSVLLLPSSSSNLVRISDFDVTTRTGAVTSPDKASDGPKPLSYNTEFSASLVASDFRQVEAFFPEIQVIQ